jgi:hypothetical protein
MPIFQDEKFLNIFGYFGMVWEVTVLFWIGGNKLLENDLKIKCISITIKICL